MYIILQPLLDVILKVISLYQYVLIATVIISWLIAFDIINTYSRTVMTIINALHALTEPLLAPIRRLLPPMGGLDLSVIVLLLGLWFVQGVVLKLSQAL